MSPFFIEHWPLFAIGATSLSAAIGAAVGIIKGWNHLLATIKKIVGEALESHSREEKAWQREVDRRLETIERKVDDLNERGPRG